MIRYLTGVSNPSVIAVAHQHQLGLLNTPDTKYDRQVADYPFWAADNACFNHPERFVTENYLRWLDTFSLPLRASCMFASAPDVLGDATATLERSAPVLSQIRDLGYRAALVGQDGMELLDVPWESFDVLFLGGTTAWKLSPEAKGFTQEALQRGKTAHMGRVNSYKRLRIADRFGCATADGTFLKYGPAKNLPRLLAWFPKLEADRLQRNVA